MSRLRQDSLYVMQGIAVTLAVLLAIAVITGAIFLLLLAFAPGRFREILQEFAPTGLHWAVLLAAVLEGIYVYLLRQGRFVSKGFSSFVLILMGAIVLLVLVLGISHPE